MIYPSSEEWRADACIIRATANAWTAWVVFIEAVTRRWGKRTKARVTNASAWRKAKRSKGSESRGTGKVSALRLGMCNGTVAPVLRREIGHGQGEENPKKKVGGGVLDVYLAKAGL
jgi:hypothetical protein